MEFEQKPLLQKYGITTETSSDRNNSRKAAMAEYHEFDADEPNPGQEEPTGYDLNQRGKASTRKRRMIDWLRGMKLAITAPFVCIIIGLVIGFFVAQRPNHDQEMTWLIGATIWIAIFLAPYILVIHFIGYVFDPLRDRLSYPVILYRRSIRMSEMTDANSETRTNNNRIASGFADSFGTNYGGRRVRTRLTKIYAVNVSGDFGVRQMRFGGRYKRDQFFSLIRNLIPHCRVTRQPWY